MSEDRVPRIAAAITATDKYRHLAPDVITAFATRGAARFRADAEAVAWARRKLHEAFGAFLDARGIDRAQRIAGSIGRGAETGMLQGPCAGILACHASTAERQPELPAFYERLFAKTGMPRSLADLACGFHPFAWPWTGLSRTVRWIGLDLDRRVAGMVTGFFVQQGINGAADARDLLAAPMPDVDLTLLLKTLPLLERQEPGGGERILKAIRSSVAAVSFPAKSLGGRNVGMRESHAAKWEPVFKRLHWKFSILDAVSERVYVLTRRAGA